MAQQQASPSMINAAIADRRPVTARSIGQICAPGLEGVNAAVEV
jgi:hypothetical protein